jgi:hypothetical protein
MTSPIPNRIIQTGKRRELPLLEQAAVANLKALNPGFDYIYFDDADVEAFIRTEFPGYRSTFERFRHRIQRYDFFRYLAVYRLGGYYFDLDVFFARGIAGLAACGCVFPFEELTLNSFLRDRYGLDWEVGNYGFGAAAGHPFLWAVIENCVRAQSDPAWVAPMLNGFPRPFQDEFYVLSSTGPGLVTRTLAERPDLARSVSVLFPPDVCDSSAWHQFGDYGVHLMQASWRPRGNFLKRRLAQLWENRTRRRLLVESRKAGPGRTVPGAEMAPRESSAIVPDSRLELCNRG